MKPIRTFVINLEKRVERKAYALEQFKNKPELHLEIVKAIKNKNGALGLWQTIVHIVKDLATEEDEYILICEDDHQFTKGYSFEKTLHAINEAKARNADVFVGGVSWFADALQISEDLFWVNQFTGTQFMVVFKKFYQSILHADFNADDTADRRICTLTDNKFFIYPFISIQKEFGYSDATPFNNKGGYVTELFEKSGEVLSNIIKVNKFYKS